MSLKPIQNLAYTIIEKFKKALKADPNLVYKIIGTAIFVLCALYVANLIFGGISLFSLIVLIGILSVCGV